MKKQASHIQDKINVISVVDEKIDDFILLCKRQHPGIIEQNTFERIISVVLMDVIRNLLISKRVKRAVKFNHIGDRRGMTKKVFDSRRFTAILGKTLLHPLA